MPQKRWLVPQTLTEQAERELSAFHPVLRQVLFNRGLAEEAPARTFLEAESPFDTDPYRLKDMALVIDRIRAALKNSEKIAIYGDYDADGVTATALLVQILKGLGADVVPYIPNRFDEGYGLNNEALDSLRDDGVKLVITVDCGIRSPAEAEHARAIGLDMVISDHHHPLEGELPAALAVINPKQPGDEYPDKGLAGVGLAYKIAEALLTDGPANIRKESVLDLVALGTVADLAPLVDENRALVRKGIAEIRKARRQGLFSLANAAEMSISRTTANQIGFILGPRLNAAGRLTSAQAALELLTTSDSVRAGKLAQELDSQNRERQILTRDTQQKAEALAMAEDPDAMLLFAVHEEFNPGVVGLAASRLTEAYYRPAVVAARGPEETRASCRSIPEFNITDALDQCADLLVRHGGHAAAAGFTVRNSNLVELIRRLKDLAREQLGGQELRPTLRTDGVTSLSALSFDLLKQLAELEPTGYGNPEAVFVSRDVKVKSSKVVGSDGKHLKLTLEDERGASIDAIGFRFGLMQPTLTPRVDLAYTLEANEYNGRTTLQLNLKDLRPAGSAD